MSKISNDSLAIEIEVDDSDVTPTVRFDPLKYHTKLEQQVYDQFWSKLEPLPITQRARP